MTKQSVAAQQEEWCKHFTGLHQPACAVGVLYASVEDTTGPKPRWPCFQRDGVPGRCAQCVYPTPEEAAATAAEITQRVNQFVADLAADICPHCKAAIQRERQDGRCVYAVPCGHRLYQGRAKR